MHTDLDVLIDPGDRAASRYRRGYRAAIRRAVHGERAVVGADNLPGRVLAGAEEHQVDDRGRADGAVRQLDADQDVRVAAADGAAGDLGHVGVAEERGERGGREVRAAVPRLMTAGLIARLPGAHVGEAGERVQRQVTGGQASRQRRCAGRSRRRRRGGRRAGRSGGSCRAGASGRRAGGRRRAAGAAAARDHQADSRGNGEQGRVAEMVGHASLRGEKSRRHATLLAVLPGTAGRRRAEGPTGSGDSHLAGNAQRGRSVSSRDPSGAGGQQHPVGRRVSPCACGQDDGTIAIAPWA